jgi:hypothetical protein
MVESGRDLESRIRETEAGRWWSSYSWKTVWGRRIQVRAALEDRKHREASHSFHQLSQSKMNRLLNVSSLSHIVVMWSGVFTLHHKLPSI